MFYARADKVDRGTGYLHDLQMYHLRDQCLRHPRYQGNPLRDDRRQPFQYRPDDDQVVAPVPYTVCRGPFPCGRPFCAGSFCLRRCTGVNRRYRFSSFCAPCYGASDRQRLYLHGSGSYLYPQRPARADPRRPYHLRECGRLYHEPESSFYPIFSGRVREKSGCPAPGTPEMDARRVCAGLLP